MILFGKQNASLKYQAEVGPLHLEQNALKCSCMPDSWAGWDHSYISLPHGSHLPISGHFTSEDEREGCQ